MVPSVLMRRILPRQVAQRLGVGGVGVLPDGDVELAVRAEMHRAAVVVGGAAQVVQFKDDRFASGARATSPLAVNRLTRLWIGRCRGRVIDVHEVVGGKIRVERDPQKAALAVRIDRQGEKRRRQENAVLDDAHLPALLAERTVGRRAQTPSRWDC